MDGKHQQMATLEIPVIMPPELYALAKELIALKNELRSEIDFFRETRHPVGYSESQVAEMFGICLDSMRQLRKDGKIAYTPVAGKFWYSRRQIQEYLDTQETKGSRK